MYRGLDPGDVIRTESCAEFVYLGKYQNAARPPLAGPRGQVLPAGYLYAEALGDDERTMDTLLSPDFALCSAVLTSRPKKFEAIAHKIDLAPYADRLRDIQGLMKLE